jgi:aspartyl-tRNA(Asn)/glutamyl-tRNA(Gln) amidotransferase subunit A
VGGEEADLGGDACSFSRVSLASSSEIQLIKYSEFNNTYLKALYVRQTVRQDYAKMFRIPHPARANQPVNENGVDVLLHPTAIGEAPILYATSAGGSDEYLQDTLTVPASLAGLPSMSVPAGTGQDGWPLGISVTSQWGMEDLVFRVGEGVEGWNKDTTNVRMHGD